MLTIVGGGSDETGCGPIYQCIRCGASNFWHVGHVPRDGKCNVKYELERCNDMTKEQLDILNEGLHMANDKEDIEYYEEMIDDLKNNGPYAANI